jgi:hypothetical protein
MMMMMGDMFTSDDDDDFNFNPWHAQINQNANALPPYCLDCFKKFWSYIQGETAQVLSVHWDCYLSTFFERSLFPLYSFLFRREMNK